MANRTTDANEARRNLRVVSSKDANKKIRTGNVSHSKHNNKPTLSEKKKQEPFLYFKGDFDKPFFVLIIILLVLGTVAMFSASYAWALQELGDGYYYVKRQILIASLGLVAMLFLSCVNYKYLFKPKIVYGIFIGTLLLLAYTSFFGNSHNNARRWITIGPIEFQPSEIMKFAVALLFAYLITVNYTKMKQFKYGILPFGIVLGIIALLMMIQPHLSGTIVICGIGLVMIIVGGAKIKHLILLGSAGAGGLVALVLYKISKDGYQYFGKRMQSWLEPFSDMTGSTWQTCQSLIAIGSGGLFGMGFGNSRQKFMYLPESKNDFVFAVWCEELGFIGAILIILLFLLFAIRGFYIANKAPDKFGMMLCVGLTVQIGIQAMLNIAVVTNTIPNTGISLPFFSYGGTAIAMQLAQMGIILNISRHAEIE